MIERPLPSSRFPPWDLLRVLSFLRGPPFEPLSLFVAGPHPQGALFGCLSHGSLCWGTKGGVFVSFLFQGGFVPLLPSGISGENRVSFQPSASLLCNSFSERPCWLSSG